MGFGLIEYKEIDTALEYSAILRFLYSAGLAGTYYMVANKNNFFSHRSQLMASLAVFTGLSFYYSKGLALHTAGLNAVNTRNSSKRQAQLEAYERNPHRQ
jgi:hypothetical protein